MRIKLLILSIIVAAGFSFADDAVLFGNVLETDLILTPAGITNAILATALTAESDPVAYPVATNALALAAGALPVRLNAYTYNVDDGYWLQLHSPWQRALLTTSTLQFFMGSTMTLGLDSDSIRINGRNYFWPAKAQDETLLTSSDIFGLASKSYVDTTFPTKSYVENTRWSADDIATNLSYNVVVSNGHWIIRESLK